MAKKRQEDPPQGSPAWMATFSDLMNLLLCFFVMLFSMSNMDAQKFELLADTWHVDRCEKNLVVEWVAGGQYLLTRLSVSLGQALQQ